MTTAEKLQTIAENEQKVYDAGRKSQYDEFWDAYQDYGRRTNYRMGFAGRGWTDEYFKPKYTPILITDSNSSYQLFGMSGVKNIPEGVLDLSQTPRLEYTFFNDPLLETIAPLDCSACTSYWETCRSAIYLKKIGFLNIREDAVFYNVFERCFALEELTLTGTLGTDGFSVKWSTKLNKASWTNIINILSNTTSGLTVTGSLVSVNKAFETAEGANDGSTSTEWTSLIATKSNWTISLV